jgi:protein-disulfide isomerase
VAVAVVAVLIAVSQAGGGDGATGLGGGEQLSGSRATIKLFDGVPQQGAVLGDRNAPARLIEFVDLQCPFCAQYTRQVLPTIVDRYVRSGRLRVELRPLTFIGDDSVRAAAAAEAAARQNRAWQFIDLFYRNQGPENSGYVTDDFIRQVARGAQVQPAPLITAADSGQGGALVARSAAEASRYKVQSTPSFLIATGGGQPQPLQVGSLTPDAFVEQIDSALKGR